MFAWYCNADIIYVKKYSEQDIVYPMRSTDMTNINVIKQQDKNIQKGGT